MKTPCPLPPPAQAALRKGKRICLLALGLLSASLLSARERLSLAEAMELGAKRSIDGMVAQLHFMSAYWSWRSYKAELLPSIRLTNELMQYSHSTVEARDAVTGRIYLVEDNTLNNSLTLSVDQHIVPLGGTFSLQSYVRRLDQFNYDSQLYNAQPLRLSYRQPIFAYNELKWRGRTEPFRFKIAGKAYLEAIEDISLRVIDYFFAVLTAQEDYKRSQALLEERTRLFEMAQKRLELGTLTRDEVLQLELTLLNAQMSVKEQELQLNRASFALLSYLRLPLTASLDLEPPYYVPAVTLDQEVVWEKALKNASFVLDQQLEVLQAQQALARAKSTRGVQVQLNSDIGFRRTADRFPDAFRNMQNNQVVGLSLSVPLFDWGMGKGRVRMAQADLEAVTAMQAQQQEQFKQDLETEVLRMNMQNLQCAHAKRAQEISMERYELARKRFENGSLSVTELNNAWQEAEQARASYIVQLRVFWSGYHKLRRTTLYDWVRGRDLEADFETLIESR